MTQSCFHISMLQISPALFLFFSCGPISKSAQEQRQFHEHEYEQGAATAEIEESQEYIATTVAPTLNLSIN